jgi:putative nucleotidyltransferase with HDIG domain
LDYLRAKLTRALLQHFGDDDRRIEHALCVLHSTETLLEKYPGCDPEIAIAAALLHDVGIRESEARHGYNDGRTQEEYGPPVAGAMLEAIGFPTEKIRIVKEIIGNHHSPSRYAYPELALLKEADLIVNRREDGRKLPEIPR